MKRYGLYFAWVIAAFSSIGSFYFSDIRLLEPCNLCWYQRICLLPLTIILAIACFKGFLDIVVYVLPQTVIGLLLALYQIAIQEIPNWNPINMCGAGPSCSIRLEVLGFLTIPMLSAIAFLLINFFLFYVLAIKNRA